MGIIFGDISIKGQIGPARVSYEISLFLKWNENLKTEAKKPFIGLAVAVAENKRDSADLGENMV